MTTRLVAKAVVIDLDGTVCSTNWRSGVLLRAKDNSVPADEQDRHWTRFFGLAHRDRPIPAILQAVGEAAAAGHRIVVVTGRPEWNRDETARWLRRHGVEVAALHMRPNDDRRSAADLKRDILDRHIAPFFEVVHAYEDDERVADMYRERKIPVTLMVDPGLRPYRWPRLRRRTLRAA